MRTRVLRWEQWVLGLLLLFAVAWNLAQAREVRGVQISHGATGTRAEITLDGKAQYRVISLANPDRLVIDVEDTQRQPVLKLPAGRGIVTAVRQGSPAPGITRIVFDLADNVVPIGPNVEWRGERRAVIILEWPGDGESAPTVAAKPVNEPARPVEAPKPAPAEPAKPTVAATTPPAASEPAKSAVMLPRPAELPPGKPAVETPAAVVREGSGTVATGVPTRVATGVPAATHGGVAANTPPPVRTVQDVMRGKAARPLIIAIDAGHGGQDTGALGAAGTREKDITLRVARELARQVDAMPGMKAYLTRDADFFIPLEERYKKARAAKADVFVSIHADAFTNPAASGSSVFVLSQRGASSQAARWLANQENAADLVGGVKLKDKGDTLASVLLDLSQSATQRASEAIASDVLGGLARIGKTHKNEIERANFVVLRSPDVPSMLVETAFISNPDEERRLNDPAYQRQLARAVLDGIDRYFTRLPPPGTWYAARRNGALAAATDATAAN